MANNSSKGIASPLPREGAGVGSKSVVVAFSGGLDTSYTVMKLTKRDGMYMLHAPTPADSALNS